MRPRIRRQLNPKQKLPEPLKVQVRPKRDRRRSSCPLSKSSGIIQVKHLLISLQWEFLAWEPIWLEALLHRTAYVASRRLTTLKANAKLIRTKQAPLLSRIQSLYRATQSRHRGRCLARRVLQNPQNQLRKVSLILNFWRGFSKYSLLWRIGPQKSLRPYFHIGIPNCLLN